MAEPAIAVEPRRMLSPHPAFERAQLEPVHQPLYSAAAFDAALCPAEVNFFTYSIGGIVSGAGAGATAASLIHTNMETAGFLAAPKIFLAEKVSIVVSQLNATLSAQLEVNFALAAAVNAVEMHDDLCRLLYGSWLRWIVGTKDYFVGPAWLVPGNYGLNGIAAAAIADTDVVTENYVRYHSVYGYGKQMKLSRFPVLLPSQQNFRMSLNFTQNVRPTLIAARLVYANLHGLYGREVQ